MDTEGLVEQRLAARPSGTPLPWCLALNAEDVT